MLEYPIWVLNTNGYWCYQYINKHVELKNLLHKDKRKNSLSWYHKFISGFYKFLQVQIPTFSSYRTLFQMKYLKLWLDVIILLLARMEFEKNSLSLFLLIKMIYFIYFIYLFLKTRKIHKSWRYCIYYFHIFFFRTNTVIPNFHTTEH